MMGLGERETGSWHERLGLAGQADGDWEPGRKGRLGLIGQGEWN